MFITDHKPTIEQMPVMLLEMHHDMQVLIQKLNASKEREEIEQPVDIKEAARFTNLDEQTVYRQLRDPNSGFPGYKKNSKWYFFKSELNEYIRSGKCKTIEDLRVEAEEKLLNANKRRG